MTFNENYEHFHKYDFMKEEVIIRKKESLENRTKRILEQKYTSRSNLCDVCFTYKSTITGECNC